MFLVLSECFICLSLPFLKLLLFSLCDAQGGHIVRVMILAHIQVLRNRGQQRLMAFGRVAVQRFDIVQRRARGEKPKKVGW